ncbi:hypothetical protein [Nocardia xishanensis]
MVDIPLDGRQVVLRIRVRRMSRPMLDFCKTFRERELVERASVRLLSAIRCRLSRQSGRC